MGIFAQVWFWSALAFVAGALLSWALLALPARRQLAQLDRIPGVERESAPRPLRQPVPPLPERRYDDDPLDRRRSPFDEHPGDRRHTSPFDDEPDDRRLPSPFDDEPDERRSPFDDDRRGSAPFEQDGPGDDEDYDLFPSPGRRSLEPAARTELMSGVGASADTDDDVADRGLLRLSEGQSVSPPTVRVPVSGSLDEGSLFAPPEPPLPGRSGEDEAAATQFLPAIAAPEPVREIEAPPEVAAPGKRDWFEETGDHPGSGAADDAPPAKDETLVDDLAVDPRQAESSELVDDVEDIERPADTGGTIFTQRTQPVSGELISSLDGKSTPDDTESEVDAGETVVDAEPVEPSAPSSASQPTTVLPVRKPGANRFDTGSRSRPSPPKPSATPSPSSSPSPKPEPEATQVMPAPAPAVAAASSASSASSATEAMEPERARSLFEPIVPADESVTTSMAAPAAAAASTKSGDGAFVPPGPFGPGSAMPLPGGGSPSSEFTVKASVTALRYCEPDSPLFGRTVAEVWFRTTKDAERVGFRPLS